MFLNMQLYFVCCMCDDDGVLCRIHTTIEITIRQQSDNIENKHKEQEHTCNSIVVCVCQVCARERERERVFACVWSKRMCQGHS